ncbi:hypothetical protein KV112_18295 [Mycolicibacter sp. MYC123]|uniref:Uncharacterized protein n=1 Tax=[Mycobacterium] zoologicum TaxID=2872311 RepID=A0ABU5YNM3_9MYCO|nr:hypothetical protein [Mycolicibacter sp. MYC123]MEB3051667.1 hypothetical protein [Mycolicibacter sp. MYC123]
MEVVEQSMQYAFGVVDEYREFVAGTHLTEQGVHVPYAISGAAVEIAVSRVQP